MHTYGYEKLIVWQKAMDVSLDIYSMSGNLPRRENYNIVSQLDRATVSITNNLAEGSARVSRREQARFTEIAYGSLVEVTNLLTWCLRLKYIDQSMHDDLRVRLDEVAKMLNGLHKRQKIQARQQKKGNGTDAFPLR